MICAEVLQDVNLQAEDSSISFCSKFNMVDVTAAMNRGETVLAARFNPFDRFAESHRNKAHQRLFRIHVQLGSKAPANLRSYDSEIVFRKSEHAGDQRP